jgi:hypothetical protein
VEVAREFLTASAAAGGYSRDGSDSADHERKPLTLLLLFPLLLGPLALLELSVRLFSFLPEAYLLLLLVLPLPGLTAITPASASITTAAVAA